MIDAFVLPSAVVRPGFFFHVKRSMVWLMWLAVAVVAALVMIYPRDSLINALTMVKLLNESFHEAFDNQPLKRDTQPEAPGKPKPQGTITKNGKLVSGPSSTTSPNATGTGPGSAPAGTQGQGQGQGSTSPVATGSPTTSPQGTATAEGQGTAQANGQPMVINTPTGSGEPDKPKFSLNLIVPGGAGGGQQGPVAMPPQQGPAPTSIIINNNGGGAGGQSLPPVTITQVGQGTGGPMSVQTGGVNQPPSTVIVNGQSGQPTSVVINGRTIPVSAGVPVEEPGGGVTPTEPAGARAGLHRGAGGMLVLPPDWPRSVALRSTPNVMKLERTSEAGHEFAAQTEHYEFQSDTDVGADVVRELSRVFEATYELNSLLPLRLHPAPEKGRARFIARLFSKDRDYFAAGGMPGSAGTYSRDQACILVPISSVGVKMVNGRMQTERTESTQTLIHEITHQMMNAWLPLIPRWYAEGSADYIAMADYVHGRFILNQIEDRLRRYLRMRGQQTDTFIMLRPAELMALDAKTWSQALASNAESASQNYASATLLTFYFYHLDGNGDGAGMLKYLRALERGSVSEEAVAKHLLRGRTMEQLESDVLNAFERRGLKVSTVARGSVVKQ